MVCTECMTQEYAIKKILELQPNMLKYWYWRTGILDMTDSVDNMYAREYYLCMDLIGQVERKKIEDSNGYHWFEIACNYDDKKYYEDKAFHEELFFIFHPDKD